MLIFFWQISCIIVIATDIEMTTNNNKQMITSEIMRIRQLFFSHITFYHQALILINQVDIFYIHNF